MSEFLCIISIFHNFCGCPNSHTGVRKSATFAGVRIRTLVCEKKNYAFWPNAQTTFLVGGGGILNN